jgi:hypothetical protein
MLYHFKIPCVRLCVHFLCSCFDIEFIESICTGAVFRASAETGISVGNGVSFVAGFKFCITIVKVYQSVKS